MIVPSLASQALPQSNTSLSSGYYSPSINIPASQSAEVNQRPQSQISAPAGDAAAAAASATAAATNAPSLAGNTATSASPDTTTLSFQQQDDAGEGEDNDNRRLSSQSDPLSAITDKNTAIPLNQQVTILTSVNPLNITEYSHHLNRLATLLYENIQGSSTISQQELQAIKTKFFTLMDGLYKFINYEDPVNSKLYLIIQYNFDIFITISTNCKSLDIATKTIRFLTLVIMNLNYWEIYNLLNWKPVIYHFLTVINFDLNDCYTQFINDYSKFSYTKLHQPIPGVRESKRRRKNKRKSSTNRSPSSEANEYDYDDEDEDDAEEDEDEEEYYNQDASEHDKFVRDSVAELTPKEKKKLRTEMRHHHHHHHHHPEHIPDKVQGHKIIKKSQMNRSNKSSNYDPDVIHECQLASADEPDKLCLRRFSRKYELIRHQETVHSKKKKLFKCYVCVKQNPGVGPRIFTRHDTLAKHIRVNHKISGKEAKAEVAYSKKHAEVVEEGDITVHVGRRKTKVDFELRAHMERRKSSGGKDSPEGDDSGYLETTDIELDSGDEEVTYNP
ncbi:Filamentous growth regulator 15 [Spathaspora sp. JA1]|nr:Filamentous growth regulator 15 [Spathaspora sp. JA1]